MMQVDWLTEQDYGRDMLLNICTNEECLTLFKQDSLIKITEFLWSHCQMWFIKRHFAPFIYLNMGPLCILIFLMQKIEDDNTSYVQYFFYFGATVLYLFGTLLNTYREYEELRAKKAKVYFRSYVNYIQWVMIGVSYTLCFQILIAHGA